MEEEAPPRRSVAELAGRFKGSALPHSAAGNEAQEKPVRRRPPRTLQLPKTQGDDQEPPSGVTSPLPAKAKRNSALIEKLQANLVLSPSGPPPKSPGCRLLSPTFTPPLPGSAPVTTVTTPSLMTPTSPVTTTPVTEEEGPASFEAPPTAAEGSILSSFNKGRPRLSIRRRPPSRRHRKSSCEDDVGLVGDATETQPTPLSGAEDKTTGGEQEGPTDAITPDEKHQTHEEDETKSSSEVKEEENGPTGGEAKSSSEQEEEEKEQQDSTEAETKTDEREEEEKEEATSQSSAR